MFTINGVETEATRFRLDDLTAFTLSITDPHDAAIGITDLRGYSLQVLDIGELSNTVEWVEVTTGAPFDAWYTSYGGIANWERGLFGIYGTDTVSITGAISEVIPVLVPLPGTLVLLALGIGVLMGFKR